MYPAMRVVVAISLCAVVALALPWLIHAQETGGTVTGTVTGPSGAAMPGVQISLRDVGTGVVRIANTTTEGSYSIPDLPAGKYEVTATAQGFVTQIRTGLSVAAGTERVLNIVMRPGRSEVAERATATPDVNEQSAAVGGAVNAGTVRDTPLNGRDWAQLATLQAGVTGIQSSGVNTQRGFGAAISISGARPDQNSYRLDGVSINDYSNGAPGSVLGDNLGIDAVEQVSVLGSNYPAEYGRTSGGVINAVTRSGTNAFHGTLYEFLRNSALDARNFFDGPTVPPFKRNQFGGSAGLPIQKDRTFIFGDYEGLRQSLGVTTVNTVPSPAARSGQLSTGTISVDPAVARFLAAFYPLPNGPLLGSGDIGIFTFADQQVTNENYFTIRVDRKFSERDVVSGTYMRDNSKTVQPGTFDELLSNVVSARQVAAIQQQHVFSPASLNAVRFGFTRAVGIIGGVSKVSNPLMSDPSYAFEPGTFAGSIENVPGLTRFRGAPSIQGLLPTSSSLAWNSFQAGDEVFLIRGKHALKFGGMAERIQDNQLVLGSVNGAFRFNSLRSFLTNQPQAFQGNLTTSPPKFGIRQTIAGAYIQDDIRVKRSLTLNVGLRYEMATVPHEAHNRIANLVNLTDAQPHVGAPFFLNPTLRNFEPRAGFAWNPRGGKTLVRSGFGIFDVLPLPYEFAISYQYGTPFVQQVFANTLPPGSFPTGAFQQTASMSTSLRSTYVEHAPKRNYVMQWNLGIARELSSTLTVTVGYVGSRGVHQPYKADNIDMVLPVLTPAGYEWPCGPDGKGNPCATGFLPTGTQANPLPSVALNPNFGRISANLWQANSFYDALQVDIAKRMSHGVQFHAAYTWGKSIDTLSATSADDAFPNGLYNQLFFDQRTTRGLSDFDVAQTLVLNFTWQAPNPKWHSRVPSWILSGWQLGGLYKASTGQPFTPILGGDPVGQKLEETGVPPDRINGPGCETLTNGRDPNHYIRTQCLAFPVPNTRWGNVGRNTVIGPGISKLDFSVFKNNPVHGISESFNIQFRAELFNILNRANFSSPTDNLSVFDKNGQPVSGAGLITSTQTTSRQVQLALKLIW